MREACAKFDQRQGEVCEMAEIGTKQHNSVDSRLDDPELPDYRAAAVVDMIHFCDARAALYPGGTVLKEAYLPIDDEKVVAPDGTVFKGTTAGYADFAVVSKDELEAEIIDFKFGNNAVEEAKTNLQGIAYALGLRKRFPKLRRITVKFTMPHLDYITEHAFVVADFDMMLLRVQTVVARAVEAHKNPDDFSTARANISSCLFCAHVGRCPKVAEIALAIGKKYRPLEIPANITPSTIFDSKDASLGVRLAAILATWSEAYRRQATARTIEDPDFIPDGYTLVESQRRLVVKAKTLGDVAKAFIPAEHQHLVDDLFKVPIGDLEKLVSTFAERGNKEKSVEKFSEQAIQAGALELGKPFAFLRQSRIQDTSKVAKD